MSGTIVYLDSSAIVKILVREEGSSELSAFLAEWPQHVSSALARVEVRRAVLRAGAPRSVIERGEEVLERMALLRLDDTILDAAALLEPPTLRSLDAIHLAAALSIRGDLRALITYDDRLAEAAAQVGLSVWPPGSGGRPGHSC